jgi:hypothetical protein
LSVADPERGLTVRRYAEACADFYGVTDEEKNALRRDIETKILAGHEPDWNALAVRIGKSMTDADLLASGLTQDDIELVRSYYA